MSKHLDNLERLCKKLQFRYGTDDAVFMQMKCEYETRMSMEPKNGKREEWSAPYRKLVQHPSRSDRLQSHG